MAYVARALKPYDRLLKPGGDMAAMRPGGGVDPPAAAISAAPTAGNPQASSASGFVSFDQRLQANQGGAEAMAGKVADRAQGDAQKVQGQLGKVQQGFQQKKQAGSLQAPTAAPAPGGNTTLSQAQAGAPPPGQAAGASAAVPASMVRGGAASPYDRLLQPSATAQALPSTGRTLAPTGTALRSAQMQPITGDSMQKMLTDREKAGQVYSGPEELRGVDGYDALESAALDSDDRLAATADNAGREQLVADAYAGSRTGGGSTLDAALTGAAGGARFADLRRQYAGLSKRVAEANAASRLEADAAKASTADAAKAYGAKADADDARRNAEAERIARTEAERVAREAELARQAQLPRQQQTAATADRRGVSDMTTTVNEDKLAMNDGLYYEWLAAGRPPYDAWKTSRGG